VCIVLYCIVLSFASCFAKPSNRMPMFVALYFFFFFLFSFYRTVVSGQPNPEKPDWGTEGFFPPEDHSEETRTPTVGFNDESPDCKKILDMWQGQCATPQTDVISSLRYIRR
jgi:hypothetical protein